LIKGPGIKDPGKDRSETGMVRHFQKSSLKILKKEKNKEGYAKN
jgi:hypothetical protein